MRTKTGLPVLLTTLTLLSSPAAHAGETKSVSGMLTDGHASVDLRYRYEYVDQDGVPDNAHASTLRSRVTLTSAEYERFSSLVELDYVSHIGAERYRTPSNGKTRYPIVPDPDGFSMNQAWLRYRGEDATATAGRQRIVHANQRFVGGVAWRQNEQTYDALRLQAPVGKDWSIDYAYIWDVNRIFGPDTGGALPRRFDSDSHILRADRQIDEKQKLGVYGYLLDFDNGAAASSQTYGLDYTGKLGPFAFSAAFARQSDYRDNPADYSAHYYMAELAMPVRGVTLGLGHEVLGSDNGTTAFQTPLATAHKWQGWADAFLVTPAAGVRDSYAKVAGKAGRVKLAALYHDYQPDHGSGNFGNEWNFVATLPLTRYWKAQFKYANFQARDFATDREKAWLTVQFSY